MATKLTQVGKYKIQSQLAEGGMGAVFRVTHPTLKTELILKRLTMKASGGFVERFKREARISLHLKHDHIIQVYDHFKEGSSYYIVMEYVDGKDLESILQKKRYFSSEEAILLFTEICRGLLYAHEHGVIHRDIKPANILISHDGQVKIADFGISSFKAENEDQLTQAGMSFGTPSYMSPEQFDDTKSVDNRADIYSMGVLLYEMVTGKKPFAGAMTPTNLAAIQKGKYPKPHRVNPHVSPIVQRVIRKAMHRNKRHRYQSLQHIITIFEKHLKGLEDQPTINKAIQEIVFYDSDRTLLARQKASFRRLLHKARLGLGLIICLAIIGAGAFYAYRQGWHHELLSQETMGRMQVVVNLDDYPKAPDDIYIQANLYNLVNGVADSLITGLAPFKAVFDSTTTAYRLASRRIYLPNGAYALELAIEGLLQRTAFYLAPRKLQRQEAATMDGQVLSFDVPKGTPALVPLTYHITDAVTGGALPDANLLFSRGRGWFPWEESQAQLISGATYRFRAVSEGYENAEIKLKIPAYQSAVDLHIPMTPKAGLLRIEAAEQGFEVLINNSEFYLSWGNDPTYRAIGRTGHEVMELPLAPGEYYLTVTKSRLLRGKIRYTERIEIHPGDSLDIKVHFNREDQALSLTY